MRWTCSVGEGRKPEKITGEKTTLRLLLTHT
jgi:hypothetical protein